MIRLRTMAAISALALLSGCYSVEHDVFTITALEPIEMEAAPSAEADGANVELLTGTVWSLDEERLLFFAPQDGGWRSWQVDENGLIRVPEWSTAPGMANDATGSIDSYEDFASNIPSRLTAARSGVFASFEAGKMHVLSFVHLNEDATGMAFAGRPSAAAISDFAGDVEDNAVIPSRQDGVILFDTIPQAMLSALADDPQAFFGAMEDVNKQAVWKATDLPVPLDYDDTRGIEELRRAL